MYENELADFYKSLPVKDPTCKKCGYGRFRIIYGPHHYVYPPDQRKWLRSFLGSFTNKREFVKLECLEITCLRCNYSYYARTEDCIMENEQTKQETKTKTVTGNKVLSGR